MAAIALRATAAPGYARLPVGGEMAQRQLEVILARQLASCLATPIFIVDHTGDLVYFNEPAEKILGRRYEETGVLAAAEWSVAFKPTTDSGDLVPADALPLVRVLSEGRPAHSNFWIQGHDDVSRNIDVTAFPLVGHAGKLMGAIAIFWDTGR
jgi:PAS domain-containing protein